MYVESGVVVIVRETLAVKGWRKVREYKVWDSVGGENVPGMISGKSACMAVKSPGSERVGQGLSMAMMP